MLAFFFLIIAAFLAGWVIYAVLFLAPWLPTFARDMDRIAHFSQLASGDKFYELGSGDGRVSFHMAKKYPQSKIIGIEISFFLFIIARIKQFFLHIKNITFVRGDIYHMNISDARVLYVFATPHSARRLAQYLGKNLKCGTRVISYNFQLSFAPSVAKEMIDKANNGGSTLYIYDIVKSKNECKKSA